MANPSKNKTVYAEFVKSLDDVASGGSWKDLAHNCSRIYHCFLNGYEPDVTPASDFGVEVVENLSNYVWLRRNRIRKDVAGCERDLSSEDEAINSLKTAHFLATQLISPFFPKRNDFSNRVINELYQLCFSYVDMVCSAVADGFIPKDQSMSAKLHSIKLSKEGVRVRKHYCSNNLDGSISNPLARLGQAIGGINDDFVRPFQLVSTARKKICRKERLVDSLIEEITEDVDCGGKPYRPSVIFPVAHGGIDFGILLDNAFEDKGHAVVTYPLFFSVKTRRHQHPWVENDSLFLEKRLENQDVLITEDWVTTGNTLRGILREVDETYPRDIRVATLKRDPNRSKIPMLDNYKFYIGAWSHYDGPKVDSFVQSANQD